MIQKPLADWGRESPAVAQARQMAESGAAIVRTGVQAAKTGGHYLSGVVCFGFAALWGFISVVTLLAGQLPTAIGVGLMAAAMAWGGQRAFVKARRSQPGASRQGGVAAQSVAPAAYGGASRTIEYGQGKLLRSAIVCALLAVAGLSLLGQGHGMLRLVAIVGLPLAATLSVLSAVKMFGDLTALRYDRSGLTIATLWRKETLAWSDIQSIGVKRTTTYGFYGLVKVASSDRLEIRRRGSSLLGATFGLMPSLLDLDAGGLPALVADLQVVHGGVSAGWAPSGAVQPGPTATTVRTEPQTAAPRKASREWGGGEGFDPDAIIARHLAQAGASQPQPAAGSAQPSAAARPQFGRKVA